MEDACGGVEERAFLLKRCAEWDRPLAAWESRAAQIITRLPRVQVDRLDYSQLTRAGMRKHQCHENASWYAANDHSGASQHVLGWWPHADLLILHSVVRKAGRYFCITPQAAGVPQRFAFIPDAQIVCTHEGGDRIFSRNGNVIGPGLRINGRDHLDAIHLMQKRLQGGMHPDEAVKLSDEEAAARLRRE